MSFMGQRAAITGWHEAAAQGDAEAQYRLGLLYAAGDGVPKDVVQAIRWLRKAVDQGYVEAQRKLSEMYRAGDDVPTICRKLS